MPTLFEKTWIKCLELSNRAIRSATWTGLADDRGYVTDRAVEFYRELGRGGIGLIVTGYQFVMPNGRQLPYQKGNYEEGQVHGLARLAAAVHEEGGKVAVQLVHCGGRASKELMPEGWDVWAPSSIADPTTGTVPKEMTVAEITQLVEAYAAAAARSVKAGFDAVQLHGAHGYGINQFLSALTNKRGDRYGGDIKKRYRFLGEVLEAVRAAVGEDFPVLIKLNGHDYVEGGIVPEEALEFARRLADDGIDAIEVSGGTPAAGPKLGPSRPGILKESDEAYLADIAAFIRGRVKVPIITVGGIRSPKVIQEIFDNGKADYVALSRPFIREPHLLNRWKSGDSERAACISCRGCFETGYKGLGISCKAERERKEREEA
ncbi:MAG: NADH:flavin oxidoreductase [Desulfomonile sp.]|nr:NADH:flavin oxidoreductase [Desulfomonile sp.]